MPRTPVRMSPTIGYRLPLDKLPLLEARREGDESLGMTSRRLMEELLSGDTGKRDDIRKRSPKPLPDNGSGVDHEHVAAHKNSLGLGVCRCGSVEGKDGVWRL